MSQFGLPFPSPLAPREIAGAATPAGRAATTLGELGGLLQQITQFTAGSIERNIQQQRTQMQLKEQDLSNELLAKRNVALQLDVDSRRTRNELAASDRKLRDIEKRKQELIEPAITAILALPPDQAAQVLSDNPIPNDPVLQDRLESIVADQKFQIDQTDLLEAIDARINQAPPGTPISELLNWDYVVEFTKDHTANLGYHGSVHYAKRVFESVLNARKIYKLDELKAQRAFFVNGEIERAQRDIAAIMNTPELIDADMFNNRVAEIRDRLKGSRFPEVQARDNAEDMARQIYQWMSANGSVEQIQKYSSFARNNNFLKHQMGGGQRYDLNWLIVDENGNPGPALAREFTKQRNQSILLIESRWTEGKKIPSTPWEISGEAWRRKAADTIENLELQRRELEGEWDRLGLGDMARIHLLPGIDRSFEQLTKELNTDIVQKARMLDFNLSFMDPEMAIKKVQTAAVQRQGEMKPLQGQDVEGLYQADRQAVENQETERKNANAKRAEAGEELQPEGPNAPYATAIWYTARRLGKLPHQLMQEQPEFRKAWVAELYAHGASGLIEENVPLRDSSAYKFLQGFHTLVTSLGGSVSSAREWINRHAPESLRKEHADVINLQIDAYGRMSSQKGFIHGAVTMSPFDPETNAAFAEYLTSFKNNPAALQNYTYAPHDLDHWAWRRTPQPETPLDFPAFQSLRGKDEAVNRNIIAFANEFRGIPPSAMTPDRIDRIRDATYANLATMAYIRDDENRIDITYNPKAIVEFALRQAIMQTFAEPGSQPLDLYAQPGGARGLLRGVSRLGGHAVIPSRGAARRGLDVAEQVYTNTRLLVGDDDSWRFYRTTDTRKAREPRTVPVPVAPGVTIEAPSITDALGRLLFGGDVPEQRDVVFDLVEAVRRSAPLVPQHTRDLRFEHVIEIPDNLDHSEMARAVQDGDEFLLRELLEKQEFPIQPDALVAIWEVDQNGVGSHEGWIPWWNSADGAKLMQIQAQDPLIFRRYAQSLSEQAERIAERARQGGE